MKDWKKFLIFSPVNLVTHFQIVMVVLFDFHRQRMSQGYHPESDKRLKDVKIDQHYSLLISVFGVT